METCRGCSECQLPSWFGFMARFHRSPASARKFWKFQFADKDYPDYLNYRLGALVILHSALSKEHPEEPKAVMPSWTRLPHSSGTTEHCCFEVILKMLPFSVSLPACSVHSLYDNTRCESLFHKQSVSQAAQGWFSDRQPISKENAASTTLFQRKR